SGPGARDPGDPLHHLGRSGPVLGSRAFGLREVRLGEIGHAIGTTRRAEGANGFVALALGHDSGMRPEVAPTRSAAPREVARVTIPTPAGEFDTRAFECADGFVYVAMVKGDVAGGRDVLVRVHSECLTGD